MLDDQHGMAGKICLVTGATSGLGQVTASSLVKQGAQVIVAGRNRRKAEETVQQIRAATGHSEIDYLLADFADLDQVRRLADEFCTRYDRLDVLVNNAGGFFNTRQVTIYGVEKTFLVNHLAPFLLTNLLLDSLHRGASARIVNVASDAHRYGTLDFDDMEFRRGYVGMKAYARSKLANVLITYELARRLAGSSVTVNAVHPGHVATDMWRTNFPLIGPVLKWIMGFFALTPEQGADCLIYLASSADVGSSSGRYYAERMPVDSSPESYDMQLSRELWQVSAALVGL